MNIHSLSPRDGSSQGQDQRDSESLCSVVFGPRGANRSRERSTAASVRDKNAWLGCGVRFVGIIGHCNATFRNSFPKNLDTIVDI
jgi:hypothetical protein